MKNGLRVLGIAVGMGILFWVAPAVFSALFQGGGNLPGLLPVLLGLEASPRELAARGALAALAFGGTFAWLLAVSHHRTRAGEARLEVERLNRTNQIFKTLRQITRLVRKSNTPEALLSEACSILVEARGFDDAWIALLQDGRPVPPFYFSGNREDYEPLMKRLETGWIPPCAQAALDTGQIHLTSNPREECRDCPHAPRHGHLAALAIPLKSGQRTLGWLNVSLPPDFAADSSEQALLEELAGELSMGLSAMEEKRQKRKLEESYAAVLSTTAEAVVSMDMESRITLFNPGAQRLFGYEEVQILGQPFSLLFPLDLQEDQSRLFNAAVHEDSVGTETLGETRDGARFPVSLSLTLQRDEKGQAAGLHALLHDISYRVETEREYAQLIDTAIDGFLVTDGQGRILVGNEAVCRLLGYTPEEITELRIEDIDVRDSAEEVKERIDTIRREGALRFETQHRTRDGALLEVEVSARYLTSGPPRVISFVRDIRERKRAERAVEESRERFQMLFDNMAAGVVIYEAVEGGKDFLIRDLNASAQKMGKVQRESVLGNKVTEVFPGVGEMGLLEVLREVWQTGEARDHPLTRYRDHRVDQWVENHVTRLPSGLVVAVYQDTSEEHRSQLALRESEERFREMAELLPEAVFEADESLRLTYANRRAFELFGYSEEDFRNGIFALDTLAPEDRERAWASFRDRLEGMDPGVVEYTAVAKDGSRFPILFHASTISRNGRPGGLRGIIVDLTDQKAAQEEIQASSRRFRNIVEASPMGIHLFGLRADGSLVLEGANPAADEVLGLDHARLVGKNLLDAFPSLGDTEAPLRYREAAEKGIPWQTEQIVYQGGNISGAFEVAAFQTSPGQMAVMFLEVTQKQQAREALERSEERLRMATRSGRVGVWEFEVETDTLEWDDLMYDLFGISRESGESGLARWQSMVHPEDLPRAEEELRAALADPDIPFDTEFRIIRGDTGEERHIRGMAGVLRDVEGRPVRVVGTNWDVTDDRRAKEALRVSEEKFRSVIEQSNDAVYILFQNRFDLVNRKFCEITGVDREEVRDPGFSFWELVAEESRPLIQARQRSRERGEEISDLYEFELQRRDGRTIQVEASVTEIEYRGGKAVLGVIRDITEHKSLQIQLNQAQKMESIGRLSGGVAHDLNNLLTPIIGYAELIRDELGRDDGRRESAEEIVRAGFRSRDLVRQLLAFSRQQTLEFKVTDLNTLVLGFEKLLRRTIREDIQIRMAPGTDVPTIRGDRGQIEQVLMNLAVNAQDAMPQGGTLHIETSTAVFDEAFARSRPGVTPGNYAMLSLTDTGVGMDPETRDRIFEPFFTTKEKGHGTGLGLATVYGIVKQHGGNIWVYSEPGSGTTFKCYFPAADGPREEDARERPPDADPQGSETVMVVEDEELVRKLAVSILRRKGYTVFSAENAGDCLRNLDSLEAPIDLLLTDVVLPGRNGKELFREVSARFPSSKVLFMSGYSDEVVTHRGVLEEGIAFIQKPFSVQALTQKVREALNRS